MLATVCSIWSDETEPVVSWTVREMEFSDQIPARNSNSCWVWMNLYLREKFIGIMLARQHFIWWNWTGCLMNCTRDGITGCVLLFPSSRNFWCFLTVASAWPRDTCAPFRGTWLRELPKCKSYGWSPHNLCFPASHIFKCNISLENAIWEDNSTCESVSKTRYHLRISTLVEFGWTFSQKIVHRNHAG